MDTQHSGNEQKINCQTIAFFLSLWTALVHKPSELSKDVQFRRSAAGRNRTLFWSTTAAWLLHELRGREKSVIKITQHPRTTFSSKAPRAGPFTSLRINWQRHHANHCPDSNLYMGSRSADGGNRTWFQAPPSTERNDRTQKLRRLTTFSKIRLRVRDPRRGGCKLCYTITMW